MMVQAVHRTIQNLQKGLCHCLELLNATHDILARATAGVPQRLGKRGVLAMSPLLFDFHRGDRRSLCGQEALQMHSPDAGSMRRGTHHLGNIESSVFDGSFGGHQAADHRLAFLGYRVL